MPPLISPVRTSRQQQPTILGLKKKGAKCFKPTIRGIEYFRSVLECGVSGAAHRGDIFFSLRLEQQEEQKPCRSPAPLFTK